MSNFYRAGRARAKKGYLISEEMIEGLIEQKTIDDAIEILKSTDYKKEILEISQPYKLAEIEQALQKNLIRHFFELITTSAYSNILLAYFHKFVARNLKIVLKGKALNRKYEELYKSIVLDAEAYLGRRDLVVKTLEAPSLEEAVQVLSRYSFGKEVNLAYNAYKESKSLSVFDIILDRAWVNMLIDAHISSGIKDREDTKDLVGFEVDSYNILGLLRAKFLGLSASFQKEILAKKSYYVDQDLLSNIIITESLESCYQILKGSYYRQLIGEEIKEKEDIEKLEEGFRKLIFQTAKSKFVKNPLSLGEVLAFVKLKEFEIHNVMTILFGIENGLEAKRIREKLLI
ncbi:MAG TPA: V-type ATPase subunit [Geobacterales bacterium]|nr:V-type ATPase subunit [Geobacterales bacterium]